MTFLKVYNCTSVNTQNDPLKVSEAEKVRHISGLKATKFRKNAALPIASGAE